MALTDILSNPGILGLAMAGLSRNPQAPMQAYQVYESVNQNARQDRLLEEAKQEKALQRTDTLRMVQDMLGQSQNENPLASVLSRMQGIQQMPQTINQPRNPAADYDSAFSGQAAVPVESIPNPDRLNETKMFYADLQKISHPAEAAIDFTKYPNADPSVAITLAANKFSMRKEAMKAMFDMAQEERKQNFEMTKLDKEYGLKKELEGAKGNKLEKPVNMDPNYDAVGTQVLGAEYHTIEGQRKFAELYKTDPNIRKLIDDKIARDAKNKFQGFAPIINYLPTSEGYVPVPARGLPSGSEMGKPMGIGKPIPSEQASKLAELETLKKQITDVKSGLFNPEYVGPVAGRYGSIKEKLVDIPETQVKFYATVKDMKDALLRARSGAQINEQEYKRLVGFLPDETLPAKNFKARLDRFETAVDQITASKQSQLSSAGYGSNPGQKTQTYQSPAPSTAQPTSTAPTGKPKTWEELKGKYRK